MSKGLKQMVADAISDDRIPAPKPYDVSGQAHKDLADYVRRWTGWPTAVLNLDDPSEHGSSFASCVHETKTITLNVDTTGINPQRVLHTVTPFRLRQEAVLTGCLVHESAHARYSHWQPGRYGNENVLKHSTGEPCKPATLALARVMEEARIEGLMAVNAADAGVQDLTWTMRAAAAKLLPMTELSADPNQALMEMISSWALRAGRQLSLEYFVTGFQPAAWVGRFTSLLSDAICDRMVELESSNPSLYTNRILELLRRMLQCTDNTGPEMIDLARRVLVALFPDGDAPEASGGCGADHADESEAEQALAAPSPAGQESAEAQPSPTQAAAQAVLNDMEDTAAEDGESLVEDQAADKSPTTGAGLGTGLDTQGWRSPSVSERDTKREAENFLRHLIEPTQASATHLTDTPSAQIDGAAYAAWKAGGRISAPHFFKRTIRSEQPQPPVKIAVLVDVSESMEQMQQPSAVLSWALAAAALDLRNFAGRGVQMESTLIHWGGHARVIQGPGQTLPGIREVACREGTNALGAAMRMIEEQIPGFFDITSEPVNRLIVNFTDWDLTGRSENMQAATAGVGRALEAEVNLLSVVPQYWNVQRSNLAGILAMSKIQRGRSTVLRYNPKHPHQVWAEAATALSSR